ncbi:bacteriophage Mu Gam like protein [Clostridium saccharobutylicum]|uniref:host-nuclease inhibitor Gam family protein n=1 Tax=Clostridium saccharobutylicum TaxID=169679 RepID=UPI00098C507C|nr:host-nuclease inhibitor Gam family protein [Clostridium saccharobutylicum]OOM17245.1 bacteriophage Mu Gam like protein [Clostridium saccharobutylicum]
MENNILWGQEEKEEIKQEGFKITDLDSATWVFRKLKDIADKEAEIKAVADKEISRIDTWRKEELQHYDDNKAYFEGILNEYYIEQKKIDKKFRLVTPYGKVGCRHNKKWNYDANELIKYFEAADPRAVREKKELDKKYIKERYKDGIDTETGEFLPFVTIEDKEDINIKID